MISQTQKRKLLSTWKDIANYLDCDIRTRRRWEKNHLLPVHRIEKGTSSRVFAFQDELDSWLAKRADIESVHFNRSDANLIKSKIYYASFLVFIAGLLVIYLAKNKPKILSNKL